jgi:hypothetical protein
LKSTHFRANSELSEAWRKVFFERLSRKVYRGGSILSRRVDDPHSSPFLASRRFIICGLVSETADRLPSIRSCIIDRCSTLLRLLIRRQFSFLGEHAQLNEVTEFARTRNSGNSR